MNDKFDDIEEPFFQHENTLYISKPDVNIKELQESFNFVPYDKYWENGSRYRTTSRVKYNEEGLTLLPKVSLYQPNYVNKLSGYGGIDREYDDVPISLIESDSFLSLIKCWIKNIPFSVENFSVHQIRTTDNGEPTPEGRHRDGTDWTGVYVVKRYNIRPESARTQYWDTKGGVIVDQVVQEGGLMTHFDNVYTHKATGLIKDRINEPSYRDVFVLTLPEHGLNKEQEKERSKT